MPFLLSIRLETMQPTPTAGNLTLIDLGSPVMEPSGLTSQCPQSDLTQSVQNLRKIAMILGSGSTIRTLPSHNSPLALLTSEFIGGQAKTAFLFHLAHEHPSLADCRATLDLIELLRQIRCRETVNRVDHRVQYFNEKADHYRSLYRNLDAERTDFGTQLADREADLRRLQAKLDDQSTANRRQEQDFQNQLAQIRQQQTKTMGDRRHESRLKFEVLRHAREKTALAEEMRQLKIQLALTKHDLASHESTQVDLAQQLKGAVAARERAEIKLDRAALGQDQVFADYNLVFDKYHLLKDTHAELVGQHQALFSQNEAMQQKLARIERSNETLRATDRELRSTLEGLEREGEALEQAKDTLETRLSTMEGRLGHYTETCEANRKLTEQVEKLEADLKSRDQALVSLLSHNQALSASAHQAEERLAKVSAERVAVRQSDSTTPPKPGRKRTVAAQPVAETPPVEVATLPSPGDGDSANEIPPPAKKPRAPRRTAKPQAKVAPEATVPSDSLVEPIADAPPVCDPPKRQTRAKRKTAAVAVPASSETHLEIPPMDSALEGDSGNSSGEGPNGTPRADRKFRLARSPLLSKVEQARRSSGMVDVHPSGKPQPLHLDVSVPVGLPGTSPSRSPGAQISSPLPSAGPPPVDISTATVPSGRSLFNRSMSADSVGVVPSLGPASSTTPLDLARDADGLDLLGLSPRASAGAMPAPRRSQYVPTAPRDFDCESNITALTKPPLGANLRRKRTLVRQLSNYGFGKPALDTGADRPSRNSFSINFKIDRTD